MPIMERVESYSVYVAQNDYLPYSQTISLRLETGATAFLAFPEVRPPDWLQFVNGTTRVYMTRDQYADVYHLLQSESPVFFTALDLLGFKVGGVHTELDLSAGEPPGEGTADPQSLEALVRLAQEHAAAASR